MIGVNDWDDCGVGDWFYMQSPACERPHSVMQRTDEGCYSVLNGTWDAIGSQQACILAAAAPNLLKACEAMLAVLPESPETKRLRAQAERAIAKAKRRG